MNNFHIYYIRYVFLIILICLSPLAQAINETRQTDSNIWYEKDGNDKPIIHLYFFWSEKCSHCQKARPDVMQIQTMYPWLKLHSYELSKNPENIQTFITMSEPLGGEANSVPTFMFCGNQISGYESKHKTGEFIRSSLQACYEYVITHDRDDSVVFDLNKMGETLDLPFIGDVSTDNYSLSVLTVLIAGMDAFNPCAFFVLLFLLSMMAHGQNRKKMAVIGGVFVFVSGALYFLFMAAWLNLFIYIGELKIITLLAGFIAIAISMINIKEYFYFKKGISLTIPDSKKPRLFERMRLLLRLDSMVMVVTATIILAVVANSYELLCTAGFPMVYTRILTLKSLPVDEYYLYLLLYNVVYVLPLLVIVSFFTLKLGSRNLSEREGMVLKLLSGVMMLLLGSLLIMAPQLLNNILVAAMLLLLSVFISWVIVKFTRVDKNN